MRRLVFVLSLLLLSSCLLKDEPPPGTTHQGENGTLIGNIILEEILGGSTRLAYISGRYFQESGRPTPTLQRGDREIRLRDSNVRGLKCSEYKSTTTTRLAYLDGGAMTYGWDQGTSLANVPKSSNGEYFTEIANDLPSGKYLVKMTGSSAMPGFTGSVSLPLPMEPVYEDGAPIEEGTHEIDREEDLVLSWGEPSVFNDYNHIYLTVAVTEDAVRHVLDCSIEEKELSMSAGTITWTIPAAELRKLTASGFGDVAISRSHGFRALSSPLDIRFYGFRTRLASVIVR